MKNETGKNPARLRQIFIWLAIICAFIIAFLILAAMLLGIGDRWIFHRELSKEILKMPKEGVTIPLKEYGGLSFVSGLINGKQKLNMLVDTGAGVTMIDSSLLKELKLPLRLPVKISSPDGSRELQPAIVPELTIGKLTLHSVPAVVYDLHSLSELEGHQINGVLGNNVMSNFVTTFDCQNQVMTFKGSDNLKLLQQVSNIPFSDKGSPQITAKLCDKLNQTFMIDTGDATSQLPIAVFKQLSLPIIPLKGTQKYSIFGKPRMRGSVEMPKFSCDTLTVYNIWFNVELSDGPAAAESNLGYNFLKKFRLTLDQPQDSITLEPYVINKVDELKEQAKHFIDANKYKEALSVIHKGIILAPGDTEIRLLHAKLMYGLKQYTDCLRELTRYIKLDGKEEESYFMRALTYNNLHNRNAAVQDIIKVASMFPTDPFTQLKCGLFLSQFSAPNQAIGLFNYAAKLQPDISQIYAGRAVAYDELRDYKKAVADFNLAIKLSPQEAAYLNNRAWIYNANGDFDKAIDDCNEVIKIEPACAAAFRNRGIAFIGKSDYPRAISDLNKSLTLDSTSERAGRTYYFRSIVYKKLRKDKLAETDEKRSKELDYSPQED